MVIFSAQSFFLWDGQQSMAAHVDELQEEVFIVRIAICLAAQRLDFVVDALDFSSRDTISRMRDDPIDVCHQKSPEPHQVRIACFSSLRASQAEIHDAVDVC